MHPCDFGLYLVTDRRQTNGRDLLEVVEGALRGGAGAVQLREPDLSTRDLLDLSDRLRALTRWHRAALLISDRIDVALASQADGVHLPAHSFSVPDARALLGPDRLIGVSTHRCDEVRTAARQGADFAVFGPVFDTPSKRAYGPPAGITALGEAAQAAPIAVLGIGGIDAARTPAVMKSGAAGVALIRAVLAAEDPEQATAQLLKSVRGSWSKR